MTAPAARPSRVGPPRWRPRGIYLALGLLTLCSVFASTAGVRQALVTSTQAVRDTLSAAPAVARTVTASTTWAGVTQALPFNGTSVAGAGGLTGAQVATISGQLHANYGNGTVPLAPASADWASLTSRLNQVKPTPARTHGVPVDVEVTDRVPLSGHMRLVSGQFPGTPGKPVAAGAAAALVPGLGGNVYTPVLPVVVTSKTAATFGLRAGSRVKIDQGAITLKVTGIVVPTDPGSAFWVADTTAAVPTLEQPGTAPPYWVSAVIAAPSAAAAVQEDFGPAGLTMVWTLPLAVGQVTGQQAQPLSDALTALSSQTPQLPGSLAPVADTLTTQSTLLSSLADYLSADHSADVLLWLLYVSLFLTAATVLLLAARMVVLRRLGELTLIRARGGALWQLALTAGGAAAVTCLPAAVLAVAAGVAAVPGAGGPDAGSAAFWWPVAAVLVLTVGGPALIAAWQHRLPRQQTGLTRRRPRGRARLVAEVTLAAAAVAGIVLLRQQGAGAGTGVNFYSSAAPALVAVPAVIIVLRIYPLVLRGLLHLAARSAGAPAFLGLARAARGALTPALPVFGLVLALTVAAFAGTVRDAVSRGDVAASWQSSGADVVINGTSSLPALPAAGLRAASAVPGVTHAAQVWPSGWSAPDGTALTVLAVDPASYAALVASSPGFPSMTAGQIAPASGGAVQPVLASPQAAALLGPGPATVTPAGPVRAVRVRVAGMVSTTPGWTSGGAFVILPFGALHSTTTPPQTDAATELLLNGASIDRARMTAVLRADLPRGTNVTYRADVLSALESQPLQHGSFALITLCTGLAALLGLAIVLLELALSAAERTASLARLATMGLTERQRARVVAIELLPAVITAAVAALACALALPPLLGPAIDLSVFTGSGAAVPLSPGFASVALPLVALVVLAAAALGIEIRAARQRGAVSLRVGS